MSLKYNLNKIHGDLISRFPASEIKIEESSNKSGNFINLEVNNNGKCVKMVIEKKSLESSNFDWSYYSNPLDENSHLVERNSSIDSISSDVKDIFEKNRFDSDYLNQISK